MYNISFTAIPIMWFALFDWEKEKEDFIKNPRFYEIGLKSKSRTNIIILRSQLWPQNILDVANNGCTLSSGYICFVNAEF